MSVMGGDNCFRSFDKVTIASIAEGLKNNDAFCLEYTDLGYCGMDSDDARVMARGLVTNTVLTKLDWCHNQFGNAGAAAIIQALLNNKAVREVNLAGNGITEEGARVIAEALATAGKDHANTGTLTITSLVLKGNPIKDEGVRAMAGALKTNTLLTELDLAWTGMSGQAAAAIGVALTTNPSPALTALALCCNDIGDEGAEAIAGSLMSATTVLTKLSLSGCCIYSEGGSSIANALKTNTRLQELNISRNALDDDSAVVFAEALGSRTTVLQKLDLSENEIGDEGMQAIMETLRASSASSALVELRLREMEISTAIAPEIARLLTSENQTLERLDLGGNFLDEDKPVPIIARALQKNKSLLELGLTRIEFGDASTQLLMEALQYNMTLTDLGGVYQCAFRFNKAIADTVQRWLRQNANKEKTQELEQSDAGLMALILAQTDRLILKHHLLRQRIDLIIPGLLCRPGSPPRKKIKMEK